MTDERQGLPSASSLVRYSLCPGSWKAIQALLPEERDTTNADAIEGTKRHALLEEGDESKAENEAQENVVLRGKELVEKAKLEVFGDSEELVELKEERLWLQDKNMKPVMSGKIDIAIVPLRSVIRYPVAECWQGVGLVVDYKTMYADHGDAASNLQTRAYAVLLADAYDLKEVYVALIQPMLPADKQLTMTLYNSDTLDKARSEIFQILKGIEDPFAPLLPSQKACQYCPAKLRPVKDGELPPDLPITAEILDKLALLESLAKPIKERAKEMLIANPDSIPGYTLSPGRTISKITDPSLVWERAGKDMPEGFVNACTISLPKLVKPYQEAKGLTSQAAARKELEALLADAIETKQGAPILARV